MKNPDLKKILLLNLLILMSAGMPLFAILGINDVKDVKEYHERFNVTNGDIFRADNIYGSIYVEYWDKNEVDVKVNVEVKSNSSERNRKMIDNIKISILKNSSGVEAKTQISNLDNNFIKLSNISYSIKYTVMLPSTMRASFNQKYGDLIMPEENHGIYEADVKYGNITGGNFSQKFKVRISYGNLNVKDLKETSIDAGYVDKIYIGNVVEGLFNVKYSNVKIDKIKTLKLDMKYGNLNVGYITDGVLDLKYSNVTFSQFGGNVDFVNFSYGNLKIENLLPDFTKLNMNTRYSTVKIDVKKSTPFTIQAESLKYGKCRIDNSFNLTDVVLVDKNYMYAKNNGGGDKIIIFNGGNYSDMKISAL